MNVLNNYKFFFESFSRLQNLKKHESVLFELFGVHRAI
jgi:hypothetical protein